jgi:nitrate/TMAO reductase-like tetraheme cytochrome c subunit
MATARERLAQWLRPAFFLGQNRITLAGAVLTTSAALTMIVFWVIELVHKGKPMHPYAGIIFYMVLPGIFVLGLILMPLGGLWRRYQLHKKGELPHVYPTVDLKRPLLQRALFWVAGLTIANVAIIGVATYKAVEQMDSVQFCGQTCHSVMAPEYTAYLDSPHSRVACVECHIGSGAPWFVKAKISGIRQLFAVNLKTYSRPIPSPVHDLRPARDTCEQCHWPQRFTGDRLFMRTKYAEDETNTPATSILLVKIGGQNSSQGRVGIHGRHLADASRISYISTDGRRQVIPVVYYLDDAGNTVEYRSDEVKATPEQLAKGERRSMDCIDCHNRPTHAFQMPDRAVDQKMASGAIKADLPFIKKQAMAALKTEYPDRDTAAQKITQGIVDFYKAKYPVVYQNQRAAVETAAAEVKAVYLRNIFPEMKLTWGTHPNNIGHEDFLGCFRCHDGNHKTKDGKVINNDCEACHQVLAMDEKEPKVLAQLGLK